VKYDVPAALHVADGLLVTAATSPPEVVFSRVEQQTATNALPAVTPASVIDAPAELL
jgi:hypothetical protein